MAVTYPLTLPATNADGNDIREFELINRNAVSIAISLTTGAQQKQEWSRNILVARVRLRPLQKADAATWWGFFRALRSGLGTFTMGDPHNTSPQGTASTSPGTPVVNGASQTGTSLIIDGCPNSETGWLEQGDWVQLGSGSTARLYTITEDINTDGSGNATLEIMPALRSSPADDATVTVSSTVGLWQLAEDPAWPVENNHLYSIEFTAVEVI